MRRAVYQVYVGQPRPLWDRCVASVAAWAARIGAEHIVQREATLRIAPLRNCRSENALRLGYLPILEKFNAWALLDRFDEIAVIDADVYATPQAGSIFDAVPERFLFAAAVERNMPVTPEYRKKLERYAIGQYGAPGFAFFNCGVMVLRPGLLPFMEGQTPEQFVRRKEFEPFVNGAGPYRWSTDQTLLNHWLVWSGVERFDLGYRWNALYGMLTTLEGAQLVHFLLSDHLSSDDPEELMRTGNGRVRV